MDHYYSNKPTVEHDVKEFTFDLRGYSLRFKTDAGVFSKQRIDYGSVLLIEEMEIKEDAEVLDMGCGYGPIGIVAAKLAKNGTVLMADVNERAVSLTEHNVRVNGVHNAKVVLSNLFDQIPTNRLFDVILTNPPIRAGKETVHQIFTDAHSRLRENGQLWIVIQKKQGAPSAMAKLEELYDEVQKVVQDKGYWIIKATKRA